MRVDGLWKKLTGESGEQEFFYFGAERNYDLYDILCGEVDPVTGLTGRGFRPIAPRRGLPPDLPKISEEQQLELGYSWLTLQELIDFPWRELKRQFVGFADAENFLKFLNNERFRFSPTQPRHPYSPVSFPKKEWEVVSNDRLFDLATGYAAVPDHIYTEIEFTRGYDIPGHGILTETIPTLSAFGDPREIRIIFWFAC